jgi:hypothetical protein
MNPHATVKRFFAVVLAVLYSGTQSLFAYSPESSFWSERRQERERRSNQTLLASLPTAGDVRSLDAQFPSTESLTKAGALSQKFVQSIPKEFLKDHNDLLSVLSPAHGSIRKISLPSKRSRLSPVVIHIQDVHMNEEAQWNIREAIRSLIQCDQVKLVALEGAAGDIDVSPFTSYPHRDVIKQTADFYLKENKISGPVHAMLTSSGELPRVLGIESPVHHAANIQAYRESAPRGEGARRKLLERTALLVKEKQSIFSPALAAFDQKVQAFRNQQISLGQYAKSLGALPDSSPWPPSLRAFFKALDIEENLNFNQVESERRQLIETLVRLLSKEQLSDLMRQSIAYRAGELRYADFYTHLKELCANNGLTLERYPAMDAYIQYVLLADGIDAGQFLDDLTRLEKEGYGRLAITAREKELVEESQSLWLTGKLIDFSLTPSEWKEYQQTAVNEKDLDLTSFEAFYKEAKFRDVDMTENLLSGLAHSEVSAATVAVLVTGGFHAEAMENSLVSRGVTVLSYVPKIEKFDTAQGSTYLSVFTQEKTPLDKMFQGKKLFLAQDPFSESVRQRIGFWCWARERWVGKGRIPEEVARELERLRMKPSDAIDNLKYKNGQLWLRWKGGEVPVVDKKGELRLDFEKDVSSFTPISVGQRLMTVLREAPSFLMVRGPQRLTHFVFSDHATKNTSAVVLSLRLIGLQRISRASEIGLVLGIVMGLSFFWGLFPVIWFSVYALTHYVQLTLFPDAPAMADPPNRSRPTSNELIQKTDDLERILNSLMGSIDKTGIEMIGPLSYELAKHGSVDQLKRFGELIVPNAFNFSNRMAEAVQAALPIIMEALTKGNSPEEVAARYSIISKLSQSPMNKWEEILWELELVNKLPISEVDPLIRGIIANAELRKIKSDSQIGRRMEHVAEGIQMQVGILLEHLQVTSPLFAKIRLLVKLFPRENDLYFAWSLAAYIDDVLLESKFSHKLRERIHGHFSNEDYDLTLAYIHYLETGSLEKIRQIDPFFIPDENDESAMKTFQAGGDRTVYESFLEMERLLKRIILHDPSGFENRYHVLDSHKAKTEKLINSFTEALSDGKITECVQLGGKLRSVLRQELFASSDPASRVQFMLLDEDVERLVYLQLGNYFNLVEKNPVEHMTGLTSILGDLAEQLGAYGLISQNTAELCAHIREGRDRPLREPSP